MAPAAALRRRAWVERARMAALAQRLLDVDRSFLRFGGGVLTADEAAILRQLADRLTAVEP